jgi:MFS family permease
MLKQLPDEERLARGEPSIEEPVAAEPETAAQPEPAAPPAFVSRPPLMAAAYLIASTTLALTQGLGVNMITASLPQIQGEIGATTNEATWMVAAYMAPNVSMALALVKIRNQYGLRNFAEISIVGFVIACILNLYISDLGSAIVVRFMSGIAASPMSSLGFFYMLEAFPPAKKMQVGLPLALTNISLGAPLSRVISPALLDLGGWHSLTLLELALAMICFSFVYLLPLTPIPRARVIEKLDIASYLFIAIGFGSIAVALVLGRLYWWMEAPWLGILLAVAFASMMLAAVIELNRKNPFIDIRWLASPAVLHFAAVLLVFRIVLSEQTSGAAGLFQTLGISNAQMTGLYAIISAATLVGGLACACMMRPGWEPRIYLIALVLLFVGAMMDSRSTSLTRPEQMYVSQALIAFAGALFLPPAMLTGLTNALKKGPNYILSFFIVFVTTQSIGGLLGSALFGTFVTIREKYHSSILVEHLAMTDPSVAQRIAQLGGAYSRVLTDKTLLNAEGVSLLGQQATREANVLAYNDAFLLIAMLAGVAFIALLLHLSWDAVRKLFAAPIPTTV